MNTQNNLSSKSNLKKVLSILNRIETEVDKHKFLDRMNEFLDYLNDNYDENQMRINFEYHLNKIYNDNDVNSLIKWG